MKQKIEEKGFKIPRSLLYAGLLGLILFIVVSFVFSGAATPVNLQEGNKAVDKNIETNTKTNILNQSDIDTTNRGVDMNILVVISVLIGVMTIMSVVINPKDI